MGPSRPTARHNVRWHRFLSKFILGPRHMAVKKRTDVLRSKLPLLAVNLCICLNIDHWTDTHLVIIRCEPSYDHIYFFTG